MELVRPYGSVIPTGTRTITSSSGARIITKEEWANLKPRIENLYLHEDQTFLEVKKALIREFGVSITPRQFKRKIEDWGFKKNFRKHEKAQIIRGGPLDGTLAHDRRVLNKIRLERLRRRNGIDILPSEISVINDIEMEGSNIGTNRQDETDTAPSVVDQSFAPEVHMIEEAPEDHDMTAEEALIDCNTTTTEEPSCLEGPKDVLNRFSRGLPPDSPYVGLFAELDIEFAMGSTRLENQEDVGEEQFISQSEFHNLSRSGSHKSTFMELCSMEPSDRSQSNSFETSSLRNTYHTARSRGSWSPLFEIDVFPVGGSVNREDHKRSGPSWKALIMEYKECEDRLSKLQKTLPISSPGIISTLERLTSIPFHQNFFNLNNFRKLLKARLNEKTPNTYKIVEASLRLINYCVEMRHSFSVAQFHKKLHSRILKNWQEDHPLHLQSSYSMADTLYQQRKMEEAEAMIRPVIRISLSNLGPYNDFTIKALRLLGVIIQHQKLEYLEEAERLLRLNIDILEQRFLDRVWWRSSGELLRLLVKRGHYNESISLAQHIITYVEATFGEERYLVIAEILRKQGKMNEAITFLRESSHKLEGASHCELQYRLYYEQGRCLEVDNDFREAAIFYQKALKTNLMLYALQWMNPKVIQICKRIGYCYKKLGKHDVASLFYKRVLGILHSYKQNPETQRSIERVQRWLDRALKKLEREEGTGNEKKSTGNEKEIEEFMAGKCKSNNNGDTEVIDPDEAGNEDIEKVWDEIFGLQVRYTEFNVENLGLREQFTKLDIS